MSTLFAAADIKMTLRYAHLSPQHLRDEMLRTEGAPPVSNILAHTGGVVTATSDSSSLDQAEVSEVPENTGAGGGSRTRDLLITNRSCSSTDPTQDDLSPQETGDQD